MRQSDFVALMIIYNWWRRTEQSVFSRRVLNGLLIVADFAHDLDEARSRLVENGFLRETSSVYELTRNGKTTMEHFLGPWRISSVSEGQPDALSIATGS